MPVSFAIGMPGVNTPNGASDVAGSSPAAMNAFC
jgi:hypothetical protein